MNQYRSLSLSLAAILAAAALAGPVGAQSWSGPSEMITPDGYEVSSAEDINDNANVAGYVWDVGASCVSGFRCGQRAAYWPTTTATPIILPPLKTISYDFQVNYSANGINDDGYIVGFNYVGNVATVAVLWKPTRQGYRAPTSLGTLGGSSSNAFKINNLRQVVGHSQPRGSLDFHAFVWSKGKMTDLGTLGGLQSIAHDINDLGQVVGQADYLVDLDGTTHGHAFVWTKAGGMIDLGALDGDTDSEAHAINSSDQIVGSSRHEDSSGHTPYRAVLWTPQSDGTYSIQALPGIPDAGGTEGARAYSINDAGVVVGIATDTYNVEHAFVWLAEQAAATDLGTLVTGGYSIADVINSAGTIVGGAQYGTSLNGSAVYWNLVLP